MLDEVQKVPASLVEVRFVVDEEPGQFSFLLTGSSARRLRTGAASAARRLCRIAANLLPGRAHVFERFPLVIGELLEQWVTLELHRRCRAAGRGHALSCWRTYQGAEVDAVLETPKEIVPIEVKWTTRPDRHDAKHVDSFVAEHAPRARRGLVACRTPVAMQLTERVKAIPWQELSRRGGPCGGPLIRARSCE